MSVIETPLALPKPLFLTAWDMIATSDLHPVLGTNLHFWSPVDTSTERHERAMELLTRQRAARGGRLSPLWTDTVRAIAAADREFYMWCAFADGTTCSVLVAARGEDAVRVVVNDHLVLVEPIRPARLATSLFDALPDVAGAAIRGVSVPQAVFDNPNPHPSDPLAEPVDTSDIRHITDTMAAPRDALHQLYAATRDGDRQRSMPITAIDLTGRGRVLTYLTGDDHIVLKPGTPRDIIISLNDTYAALV